MATAPPRLHRLAAVLEPRVEGMVAEMLERIRAELPSLAGLGDPAFLERLAASARSQIRIGLQLMTRSELPDALPHEALEEARLAAHAGIPLAELVQSYRIGHAVMLEHLIDGLEDEDGNAELLVVGSRALFAFIDRATALVTDAYTRERDSLVRSLEQRRLAIVRELLEGGGAGAGELGWDLAGTHVGAVAWGPEAEAAVAALGGPALSVTVAGQGVWAWLRAEPAHDAPAPEPPTGLALGRPAAGIDGFRRTYREARRAAQVAVCRGDALVRHGDVAVEALAAADPTAVRDFVERELGPLSGGGEREAVLRETLAAWFASGQNAASAAAALGVHERTIAYRLGTVHERLGAPPAARATELATALRLRTLL